MQAIKAHPDLLARPVLLLAAAALLVPATRTWANERVEPAPASASVSTSASAAAPAQARGTASRDALAQTRNDAPPQARAPLAHLPPNEARVLAETKPSDWRPLDPQNTLYMQLPAGRVIIELAPRFAPRYIANIKKLVREHYFDGLAIERVQDNFVAQWGDSEHARSLGTAEKTLPAEFIVSSKDVPFTALPDPDTYAPEAGFAGEFPAARDPKIGRQWLVHCYGMVGAGRDDDVDSGNGSELYAVIGQAPRQLDRNVALVGRVVEGMSLLSSLPRGSGKLGFYTSKEQREPIESMRLAADVPPDQRSHLEVLRTDTRAFAALIEARRNRRDAWYKVPAGRIDVCNVPIPVRSR